MNVMFTEIVDYIQFNPLIFQKNIVFSPFICWIWLLLLTRLQVPVLETSLIVLCNISSSYSLSPACVRPHPAVFELHHEIAAGWMGTNGTTEYSGRSDVWDGKQPTELRL